MTSFGHKSEWNDVGALLKNLAIPYYFGLGNHDIYNNYNDCASNNCVIRSFVKLQEHVGQMRNLYSLDMIHSDGYQFPAIQSKFKGSLSYSVDFGDVLLIQLNDYEPGKNPISIKQYVSGWEGLGAKTYDIYRYQDAEYNWLHNQLYQARKKNQIIILNQHRKDADAGRLKELINKFNVKLKFSGHYHYSLGYNSGWYESGSSARGTWLKLALNKKEKTAKVYAYDRNGLVEESDKISLNTQEVNSKPPSPAVNVKVKNEGGYVSYVKINWKDEESNKQHAYVSGNLALGNTFFYTVPPGSKDINVISWNYTWLVWEKTREIFSVWHKNSDICIKTWGTTLNSDWGYVSCQ
ncbi:metallophosphoesterase [Kalamiella sp. sgz302252]|uniref:metallophosphoesterase n=1 Tax=Pantoea sp. sgz302252 TaxID=3341827 RepID=UPI0036D3545B